MAETPTASKTRCWVGFGAGLILAAILAAPKFPLLYWTFSAVCHQIPARSLRWLGQPLPVCARCLGIYIGGAAAALRPLKAAPALVWALAGVNAIDAMVSAAGNDARLAMALAFAWLAASRLLEVASSERAAGH